MAHEGIWGNKRTVTGSAAAILLRLACNVVPGQLATDLSTGRLDGAIASLSTSDLNQTMKDLGRRKEDLARSGDPESIEVVELIRDRVVAEQRIRKSRP